jgi:hypothetical protein
MLYYIFTQKMLNYIFFWITMLNYIVLQLAMNDIVTDFTCMSRNGQTWLTRGDQFRQGGLIGQTVDHQSLEQYAHSRRSC